MTSIRDIVFNFATLCLSAAIAVVGCLSVKRRYCIKTDKDIITFFDLVSLLLWFSNTTCGWEILRERGACHSGGLRYIRSVNA